MITEGVEGKLNIKKLFNGCNKEYFSGAVPSCKVEWSGRLKRAVGMAHVKYRGQSIRRSKFDKYRDVIPQANVTLDMGSLKIQISKSLDLTENDTKAILLHEMVHILLYSQRKLNGHHGTAEFDGWIKRLRQESGLEVPFKESSFKLSPKLKAKKGYIGLIYTRDGKVGGCTFTQKLVYSDNFESTLERFINYSFKIQGIKVYHASSTLVGQLPSKRTLSSMSWRNISKEDEKQIKKGKMIFDYLKRI